MDWLSEIGGLVQQYAGGQNVPKEEADKHFDQVAAAAPPSAVSGALADAMRSSDTPPFSQLTGQLFGNSGGDQKARVINELLAAAGPMLAGSGVGGMLGGLLSGGRITPEAAQQVPPEAVQQMAQHAEQHDPSIIDRISNIYSEHPTIIKTLGSGVLAVALAKFANRVQR